MENKQAHIYILTNPKGEKYVGCTTMSRGNRLSPYKNLKCAKQPKIYNSLKTYGWDKHVVEWINVDYDTRYDIEQYYMMKYNTVAKGLNSLLGGGKGAKMSQNSKMKQSRSMSTHKLYLYNKDSLRLICIFDTCYSAYLSTGISIKTIRPKQKGKPMLVLNRYIVVASTEKQPLIVNYKENIGGNCYQSKPVVQLTLEGEYVKTWETQKDVFKVLGINSRNVNSVVKGRRNHAGGYRWVDLGEYQLIMQNEQREGVPADKYFQLLKEKNDE